jgi:sterol desaturase/sphingolipid hydroxylase (fatty acid hydroxylase superfamily)
MSSFLSFVPLAPLAVTVAYSWPIKNVLQIVGTKERSAVPNAAPKSDATRSRALYEIPVRILRTSTYFALALLAHHTWPLEEAKAGWAWQWVALIVARNLLTMIVFYGGWHSFIRAYGESPALASHKYDPDDPYANDDKKGHLSREKLYCTLGFLMSSAFECVILRMMATGQCETLATLFGERPYWSVAQLILVPFWRDGHFYFVHRFMHDWGGGSSKPEKNWWIRTFGVDPGKFIYKYVHKTHHKSENPGPWSGLSMHPIEHLIYYSCTLICLIPGCPLHPVHFLFNKIHADISPVAGHDGFDLPAGGSYLHYLHHRTSPSRARANASLLPSLLPPLLYPPPPPCPQRASHRAHIALSLALSGYFNVNFGTPLVPFDRLFGSHDDGAAWREKRAAKMAKRAKAKSKSSI